MSVDPTRHEDTEETDGSTVRPPLPPFAAQPSAWRYVRTPGWLAVSARRLATAFLIGAIALAFVPWQQTAPGVGRVIAFDPVEREQQVQAPIDGRAAEWFVVEGQQVAKGDPLVRLVDNDVSRLDRLDRMLLASQAQQVAAEAKVQAAENGLEAALAARRAAEQAANASVDKARDSVEAARQAVAGADAGSRTAAIQLDRAKALHAEGLRSDQDLENQQLKADTALAKLREATAKLGAARSELAKAFGDLDKATTEADGKLAEARSKLEATRTELGSYEKGVFDAESKQARQAVQLITATRAGTVARVLGGVGGEQVKKGTPLMVLVPDTDARAVALTIDGNDAPLVRPGEAVRVQFEGWPALQFAGWPSVAVGTFGGRVAFVDAVDNGKGQFRVVVRPDPDDAPWPAARYLRQGVKAKGWILLSQVPLGYELWRQLNDFPPTIPEPSSNDKEPEPVNKPKAGDAWKPK